MDESEKIALQNLYRNRDLVIIKHDKGRGVVILNKSDHLDKAKTFLSGAEFKKLSDDPTKNFQSLVQRTLLGMKKKF